MHTGATGSARGCVSSHVEHTTAFNATAAVCTRKRLLHTHAHASRIKAASKRSTGRSTVRRNARLVPHGAEPLCRVTATVPCRARHPATYASTFVSLFTACHFDLMSATTVSRFGLGSVRARRSNVRYRPVGRAAAIVAGSGAHTHEHACTAPKLTPAPVCAGAARGALCARRSPVPQGLHTTRRAAGDAQNKLTYHTSPRMKCAAQPCACVLSAARHWPWKWGTMLEGMDRELMLFVNTLGITVVLLLVAYHFVTARPRDAE